jgi:sarcosine oxidase delta subunit
VKGTESPEEVAQYRYLDATSRGLHVEVQKVEHPSRVHLDIESDDIEAEVARLEKLGAQRVQKMPRWWVMEAPTGQRFCVVRPQSADFAAKANTWD